MNYAILLRVFVSALLAGLGTGCGKDNTSEPPPRNSHEVMSQMRVRQLSRDLALTDEQQAKVKVLFEEEAAQIAKVDATANLSITERAIRIGELKKESYAKMQPLLTTSQWEKVEKILSKPEGRRKRSN